MQTDGQEIEHIHIDCGHMRTQNMKPNYCVYARAHLPIANMHLIATDSV